MSELRKTRYCMYYSDCDREEDCFRGELCPFFKPNPDIAPDNNQDDNTGEQDLKDKMDNIWKEGYSDIDNRNWE